MSEQTYTASALVHDDEGGHERFDAAFTADAYPYQDFSEQAWAALRAAHPDLPEDAELLGIFPEEGHPDGVIETGEGHPTEHAETKVLSIGGGEPTEATLMPEV